MKIRRFEVQNFKSLRKTVLQNVGDLTVLIGSNSSGKSNLLEALMLFANEFDPTIERNIGAVDEYVWYDRDYAHPIRFSVTLELPKDEVSTFIPSQVLENIELQDTNELGILRSISGKPTAAVWRTEAVKINQVMLIEGSKFVFKPSKKKVGAPKEPETKNKPSSKPSNPPADSLGAILQNISRHLKGNFKHVGASRNNLTASSGLTMRSAYIPAPVLMQLTSLGQPFGRPREDEKTWIAIDGKIRETCSNVSDVRVMNNRFTIREEGSDMFFPIEATGGGYQEVVALVCQLLEDTSSFFGVEEPELHLHPDLARRFFDILREISNKKQIFLTTHSTIFVDQADLQNMWLVRKSNKHTDVTRLSESKDLRNVLYELGLRPSDIFFANGVVFVEGKSDKVVFPTWARKLGFSFEEFGISTIPIHGKGSGRYHLTVWTEATENTRIPYYFILDKDAEKEARKLTKKLKTGDNLFLLKKGALEEYYPDDRIAEALKQEYDIELDEEDRKKLVTPKDKAIEKLIVSKKKAPTGWKTAIGRIVSDSMSIEEIDDEVKGILERVRTNLSQHVG